MIPVDPLLLADAVGQAVRVVAVASVVADVARGGDVGESGDSISNL